MNTNMLSIGDKRDALFDAKCCLSVEDQKMIDAIVDELISAVKGKCPTTQFSKDGALEVLAGLGMFLNNRERK